MNINKKLSTIALAATLLSSTVTMGFVVQEKNVILNVNGQQVNVRTYVTTVSHALAVGNIPLNEDAIIKPGMDAKITDQMEIEVILPQDYEVLEMGEVKTITAAGSTVGEVLSNAKIELGADDYTVPAVETPIDEVEKIEIVRVFVEHYEVDAEIDFEVESIPNNEMYVDEVKVITPGEKGVSRNLVQKIYENGGIISNKILKSNVSKEPVKQVQEVGTIEGKTINGKRYTKAITMQATAYDPSAGSKTAMGTKARVGAVAVDSRVIPLGTKLYIESTDSFPTYGFAVAEDTGGAIKGNKIDLFYNTNAQARKFGRRNVTVYILEEQ